MGDDRLIIKSILTTLAAMGLLFIFMLVMLMSFFPSTMMEFTYKLGMDDASIHYAERSYGWGEDEYFMAYGMEVAIGMGNYEKIEDCGEKLIADADFASYCARENERLPEGVELTYDQYVYGQVCVAKYKQGDKEGAVERAFALTQGFPQNNAVVAVLYSSLAMKDEQTCSFIKTKMEQVTTETLSDTEKAYFETVLALIK